MYCRLGYLGDQWAGRDAGLHSDPAHPGSETMDSYSQSWIRFLVDCPPFRHRNMQIIAPAPAAAGQTDAETGPLRAPMTGLVQRRTRPATRNEFVATADEKGTSPCFTLALRAKT